MTAPVTFLIGPRAGGRGYDVLARSSEIAIGARARAQFNALPLMLAGWADWREPGFVARIPLDDEEWPAVLLRARYTGDAAGGTVAYANGMLLVAAPIVPVDTLLAAVPEPDGDAAFAERGMLADMTAPPAEPHDWRGLGLAWRDRIVRIPDPASAEAVVRSILAAIDPPAQRGRIRGWATSAAIPASGAFSPDRAFQLVVAGDAQDGASGQYLPATMTAAGFDGATVAPPPVWRTWEAFRALGANDPPLDQAIARLSWSPHSASMAPADLLRLATATVLRGLGDQAGGKVRLIRKMIEAGAGNGDADFTETARTALADEIWGAPPAQAGALLLAVMALPPPIRAVLGPTGAVFAARADLADLPSALVAQAAESGLIEALVSDEGAGAAATLIDRADGTLLVRLLERLVEIADWSAATATLVSRIVKVGSMQGDGEAHGDWAEYYPVALGRCLDWVDHDSVVANLASVDVVRASHRFAANLMARFAASVLRVAGRLATNDPLQFAVARAAIQWLRCVEGATIR